MQATIRRTVTRFLANFGVASAKVDTIYEKTADGSIGFGDLVRLANGGHETTTLAGNATLTVADAHIQRLDPDGSNRDVTLPAEASSNGLWFFIMNTAGGAENLVVKDDGASTIATLNQNEAALFSCNGTAWVHCGIITIAQS